jgi:predicted metal-binding protein
MARVTCPHCGQRFKSSKPESGNFDLQGRSGGKAIIKCGDCGNGMLVGLIGKATPIPAEAWAEHQASMWEHFDSPEAPARHTDEVDEVIRRTANRAGLREAETPRELFARSRSEAVFHDRKEAE